MSLLATLFTNPIPLSGSTLWFVLPLSVVVAAVYKAIRVDSPRQLPREILLLTLYILAGVVGLMVAGWVVVSWRL
jgi:hypothetical protein